MNLIYLFYNRPECVEQSLSAVVEARPKQVYLVADGPKSGDEEDARKCERARERALDMLNGVCEIHTDFAEENRGCARRVSSGITQAFEVFDDAIILEDDCVPDPSFFSYSQDLLEKYRHEPRVMAISGDNFQHGKIRGQASYYFSIFPHCWGWATWRSAWRSYDHSMADWPDLRDTDWLQDVLKAKWAVPHWRKIFDKVHAGGIDSWAYRWTYSLWRAGGLTAIPNVNLVHNIGFGNEATNTHINRPWWTPDQSELTFPLEHPKKIRRDVRADIWTLSYHWKLGMPAAMRLRFQLIRCLMRFKRPTV